ncbi:MAG: cupin domain-containing protein [candidate division Zixibacteria bacterium]|nr:cupin domain-containing protein [candidate division Zixibacteria bacterium]
MKRFKINDSEWLDSPGYRKAIIAKSDILQQEGTLAQIVEIAPGDIVEPHHHEKSLEFLYVISGECDFSIDNKNIKLMPGDMLLTEPGDVHSVYSNGDEPFRVLVFKTNAVSGDTFWD